MDIVYICREGENEELRYSIRSVVQNLSHDNIWVVGGKPDWYCGPHIPVIQRKSYYLNAKTNIRRIIYSDQISEKFVLMNDDFFVMNPVETIPYMYSGLLVDKIRDRQMADFGSLYTNQLIKTHVELTRRARIKQPLDYELHVPMILEKQKLLTVVGSQGLVRSMYGNIHNVGGEVFKDVKLYTKDHPMYNEFLDLDSAYLSTEDKVFNDYKDFFYERFSTPSKFEKF